jgi:hypothetical protein
MIQEMIKKKVKRMLEGRDPARDSHHVLHVYKNAKLIGLREGTNMEILAPLLSLFIHPAVIVDIEFGVDGSRYTQKFRSRNRKKIASDDRPSYSSSSSRTSSSALDSFKYALKSPESQKLCLGS